MHVDKQPAVYIVANRYRGTIYVGVTSTLVEQKLDPSLRWGDGE